MAKLGPALEHLETAIREIVEAAGSDIAFEPAVQAKLREIGEVVGALTGPTDDPPDDLGADSAPDKPHRRRR